MQKFLKEIKETKIKYTLNQSLSEYTTIGLGGICTVMVFPKSSEEIIKIFRIIKAYKVKYYVIGNGSKLLFSDARFKGIIINTKLFNQVRVVGNYLVADSGALLTSIIKTTKEEELGGINELIGIPATIGGAIVMNAGCYGKSIGDVTLLITYLNEDNHIITLSKKELGFAYRHSILQARNGIILNVVLQLFPQSKEKSSAEIIYYCQKRKSQPNLLRSFGSTFKNLGNIPAWQLIVPIKDQLGGKAIKINDTHANFIEISSTISSQNLYDFIAKVKQKVYNKHCLHLKEEVIYVNFRKKPRKNKSFIQ